MTEIEKPLRRVAAGAIWHFVDGVKVNGPHDRIEGDVSDIWGDVSGVRGDVSDIWGNVSGVRGDVSDIRGDVSGIRGDVSDIWGDVSGIRGDVSLIPESARPCAIADWVRD